MSQYLGDISAYALAVSQGYTGTEEEFAELMADYAEVGQRAEDAADRAEAALDEFTSVTADATTLPEGSSATAEYSDGHLTLGIPKGDKGDTGAKGDGAVYAVIGNMASVIPVGTDGYLTSAYTITIPVTFYSGKDNVTGSVTSSDLYISRSSGGSGEMDTVMGSTYRNVQTATIIYAIPAGWRVGSGRITLTVTIGTTTLTYYHAYTIAPTGQQGDKGDKGDTGNTGNTPNLTIGTVTTLDPDDPATATITGTADNPVLSFGIPKGDTGEVSQAQFDEALAFKADKNGAYPELVAGTAEQILTDKGATDSVPYHYRKTGGDGADRLYDQIVGGTVCFNQIAPETIRNGGNPQTVDTKANLALQFRQSYSPFTSMIYQTITAPTLVQTILAPTFSGYAQALHSGANYNIMLFAANVIEVVSGHKYFWSINLTSVDIQTINGLAYKDNMLIDLTAMFGSTIADYIYQLEQTTAGAGVAFFKSLFPNDYYPYNAGELVSVSGLSEHKMVGFNQWDEEWEVGRINGSTGALVSGSGIRSKDFIPILPNASYYVKCPNSLIVCQYDENKSFISTIIWGDQNKSVLTSADAKYLKVGTYDTYGNVYNHDICINLSDPAKNGTYEPYKAHSYPLDSSLMLRGLFKLDANNNLYADGDTYDADGTVTRRYGIVDLGTLTWKYQSTLGVFYVDNVNVKAVGSCLCPKYVSVAPSNPQPDKSITLGGNGWFTNDIAVVDSAYTDATAFKTAMSGVMLVYELTTPTTETADPYQHLQQCDPSGTEEYVSTGIVPVGHNSFYPENLRAKVEGLPWDFASLIAPTEATFTATRNYTTGSLFIVDNVLYKATANIANGGTITPNTNCTATTLAEIISALA